MRIQNICISHPDKTANASICFSFENSEIACTGCAPPCSQGQTEPPPGGHTAGSRAGTRAPREATTHRPPTHTHPAHGPPPTFARGGIEMPFGPRAYSKTRPGHFFRSPPNYAHFGGAGSGREGPFCRHCMAKNTSLAKYAKNQENMPISFKKRTQQKTKPASDLYKLAANNIYTGRRQYTHQTRRRPIPAARRTCCRAETGTAANRMPRPQPKAGACVDWAWLHGGAHLVQTDLDFLIACKTFPNRTFLKYQTN